MALDPKLFFKEPYSPVLPFYAGILVLGSAVEVLVLAPVLVPLARDTTALEVLLNQVDQVLKSRISSKNNRKARHRIRGVDPHQKYADPDPDPGHNSWLTQNLKNISKLDY